MENRIAVKVERLTERRDFLLVKKGVRSHGRSFVLQARERDNNQQAIARNRTARFGITVTKRIGNAVVRNRVRRRLREIIRLNGSKCADAGNDYVLIARESALKAPFPDLLNDFCKTLKQVAGKKSYKKPRSRPISNPSTKGNGERQPNLVGRQQLTKRSQSTGSKIHGK